MRIIYYTHNGWQESPDCAREVVPQIGDVIALQKTALVTRTKLQEQELDMRETGFLSAVVVGYDS